MSDDVMVRPVRTYMEGAFLVSPESEPYPVSRARALELHGNGLATFEGAEAVADRPEPLTVLKPPKRSGRDRNAS